MADYSRHYAILMITSDTDWKALRARYKRLIGKWHPDRFPADTSERHLAEEHSKQIIIAYRTIERYYRDHGVLPPLEPMTGVDENGATRTAGAASESAWHTGHSAPADAAASRPAATGSQSVGREYSRRRTLVVLAALVLGTYTIFRHADDQTREGDTGATSTNAAEVPGTAPVKDTSQESGGISVGSTLGDVYAIQGIPTLTQGYTWYYGKSSIRFEQGKVVSWNQHPDNPLRIGRDQPVELLREGMFYVGSTKDEVRSIQGTPVSETETVWDYGPSRVYFERNRVVRWESSPLQPLRVPR